MKPVFSTRTLTLMSAGIAINMVIGQLASMLKLPVFLDSIGTLLVALLAGPLAAMTTGLVTNLIWGLITSPVAAAFAPVAAVIGLVAGVLARMGGFRSLPRVLLSSLVITLAVVLVATPIRAYLFGGATGSGADFVVAYFNAMGSKLLESVAITVLGVNLADKVISALIAWLIVRGLAERTRSQFPLAAAVS
ncbi:ECF transporter S component [Laribacter hongkongensis]|uniref:Putative inner membrane protein n=1 Tax=Laribacter hongkongensis TaxID=168471 RepID=A0A248LK04_9NEIS|nr:ECF transporter S component [Laribacter hongkongensis]ASJ24875.1 putative inner membrane protein [Laribacter hongkongensis]MCG9042198.1 ECF transporter S component [Laribacter hongkongensis]MCG9067522.1 ECF transporter S component [Laribacter hongkongensis]MCG9090292.1 ECF transporter S component [Laribacter hongkongensis]MCG9108373.1 ECF transporter S component [Laribacter hongkongensis]